MSIPVRRGKLRAIADELGEPIEKLIPRVYQEEGTVLATAMKLGVTPGAIRYWLIKLGYQPTAPHSVIWVKPEKAVQS